MAPSSEPINFRPTPDVRAALDAASELDGRTRSNLINHVLGRVMNRTRQSCVLEAIVAQMYADEAASGDANHLSFLRGGLWGATWMLSVLLGANVKDRALDDVQQTLGRPIPSVMMPTMTAIDADAG